MRKSAYTPPVYIGQNLYIKPSYIVSIPEFHSDSSGMSIEQLINHENLHDNKTKGKLSRKAITGLRNAINWLAISAQQKRVYVRKSDKSFNFKIAFITVTLPETLAPVSSTDLQKKLLNPFLVYLRKVQGLKNYVWRIEHQANGRLHVHITCDTFIHHEVIRTNWNKQLRKHGILEEFYAKFKHYNPNSTDIHSVKNIKNIAGYLAKYFSKKNSDYTLRKNKKVLKLSPLNWKGWYKQRLNFWNSPLNPRPISGRIWSCNYELSQAGKTHIHIPANECAEELRCLMRSDIEYKELTICKDKISMPKVIGEIYYLKARDWITKMSGQIYEAFEKSRLLVASLARNYTVFELT